MVRVYAALLAGLALVSPIVAQADSPLGGNYKVVIQTEEGPASFWLIRLGTVDGKWTGKILDILNDRLKGSTIADVSVGKELFGFEIKVRNGQFRFEGKLPKDKEARIPISMVLGGDVNPAHLEPTILTSLDVLELAKEVLAKQTGGQEVVTSALTLLAKATAKKAKPEEVRAWADKAVRAAEAYGPLWHRDVILDVVNLLGQQDGFANLSLQYARKAEGMIDEGRDSPVVKKKVLNALAAALEKAGKADEAKEVQARNDKIFYVTTKKFAGRKGKSDRVVLVELFTGVNSPEGVAADLAFDALQRTYKPDEVVLLQYHLNDGGANPLSNPDALSHSFNNVRGTPFTLFNGRKPDNRGGGFGDGQSKYGQFSDVLAEMLEEKPKASIKLSTTQKGSKIEIKADVADLAEMGPDIRLRLALVEDKVAYNGPNKLPTHLCVVREFPGGTAGTALKEKTASKTVSVDLDEVRKKLTEYLDKVAQKAEFPNKERPLEMKKLRVVAFVQNDDSGEVMQAAQVEVTPAE